MATEGEYEQEIAEVTEREAFPFCLSSVLSVPSCWKFRSEPSMCGVATRREPRIAVSTNLKSSE